MITKSDLENMFERLENHNRALQDRLAAAWWKAHGAGHNMEAICLAKQQDIAREIPFRKLPVTVLFMSVLPLE